MDGFRRVGIVGENAADLRGGEENILRLLALEERAHRNLSPSSSSTCVRVSTWPKPAEASERMMAEPASPRGRQRKSWRTGRSFVVIGSAKAMALHQLITLGGF